MADRTDRIRIAVDAMGGDNAPGAIVDGVVAAVNAHSELGVILVGKQEQIASCLNGKTYPKGRIRVQNAEEVIETSEHPVNAVRRKKDSSMVVGLQLVRKGEADAFISAGSTGALLVGGQVLVGRIKGVERAPIAVLIPTVKGVSFTFTRIGSPFTTDAFPCPE